MKSLYISLFFFTFLVHASEYENPYDADSMLYDTDESKSVLQPIKSPTPKNSCSISLVMRQKISNKVDELFGENRYRVKLHNDVFTMPDQVEIMATQEYKGKYRIEYDNAIQKMKGYLITNADQIEKLTVNFPDDLREYSLKMLKDEQFKQWLRDRGDKIKTKYEVGLSEILAINAINERLQGLSVWDTLKKLKDEKPNIPINRQLFLLEVYSKLQKEYKTNN